MTGQIFASSAFRAVNFFCDSGTSSSGAIALTGHSGMHTAQSMHSSGSMTSMLGPSWKQSTGHTSTQSVYLHLMQLSVTTWVMLLPLPVSAPLGRLVRGRNYKAAGPGLKAQIPE